MSRTPQEQLVHFLSDMYSIEQQALAQLVSAPKIVDHPILGGEFRDHYEQTKEQAELVRQRLEALGGSPSTLKDAVMRLGGKGFLLFARAMPETPGRLVDHAYSYEALEWAGYEMLRRYAERAGDGQTAEVATTIGAQERAMMERLEQGFDLAEHTTHGELPREELADHRAKHLTEVHSFERQGIELLEKSEQIGGNAPLAAIYREQLDQTREHGRQVEQRLEALGADTSTIKDAAMALGGYNWGLFFQAQSDTPAKLAAFVYAFLHLQIGGYELLKRTAQRIDDADTVRLCESVASDKRAMADRLTAAFDSAVEATLQVVSG